MELRSEENSDSYDNYPYQIQPQEGLKPTNLCSIHTCPYYLGHPRLLNIESKVKILTLDCMTVPDGKGVCV